ncbi:GNAT family N-acetyltransferase [Trinickia sp. EG282A]|uniref:GNAT family N-acetyltransferase n=1 Tax=Trinickia sp. EG282A TaxID=3237013 RepID=UPI0034D2CB38
MTFTYDGSALRLRGVPDIASAIAGGSPPLDASSALSIFHEPWWLDIATDGQWKSARVVHGNQVLGELPYHVTRKGIWRVCGLPPLTRTLGPAILPMGLDAAHELRYRLQVTSRLIEQLPSVESFSQLFDYHVKDALAFALHGFTVSARYTLQISPLCRASEVWTRMDSKTRNAIRSARKALEVVPIDDTSEFLRFYESNLASRSRRNAYGSAIMGALVNAFVERRAGCLLGAYEHARLVGAIGLVWDRHTMYYLISTRSPGAHSGTISLLLWTAVQEAIRRELTFDFDGFGNASTFHFLNGFGAALKQRLRVERMSTAYAVVRTLKRGVMTKTNQTFAPNL